MNEEGWLPYLLDVLRSYPEVTEIVVADNQSTDQTVEIASSAGCTVTPGGRPGRARNIGARQCTNNLILFLDADTIIPRGSLKQSLQLFGADSSLCAASFKVMAVGNRLFPRVGYVIADWYFRICARVGLHQGLGNAILVRAADFAAIGGFDERISVGEDVDLTRRMGRRGKAVYLASDTVLTSQRRFRAENNLIFAVKVILWSFVRLIGLHGSPIPYKWKAYPPDWGGEDLDSFKQALTEIGD